jgi:hypothetical protein
MAPIHVLGAAFEVVGAERGEAFEHDVDLGLGRDERVERPIVGPGQGDLRLGVGDMSTPVEADIKFNPRENVPRTPDCFRVALVSHGRIGNPRKPLESLGSVSHGFATRNGRNVRVRSGVSL